MKDNLKVINIEKFYEINEEPTDYNFDVKNFDEASDFCTEDELDLKGINFLPSKERITKLLNDACNPDLVRKFNNLPKSKKLSEMHFDKYLGINLHQTIHISRVQASRFEYWNSMILQIPEFVDYAKARKNGSLKNTDNEIKKESLVLKEADLLDFHILATPWWVTEMTRNGNDYSTSIKTFDLTSVFYRRWSLRTELHINYIYISLIEFLSDKKWKDCLKDIDESEIDEKMKILVEKFDEITIRREVAINLLTALTEYLSTNEYLLALPETIHEINYKNYDSWLSNKKLEGPNDFKYTKADIEKFESQFEKILLTFYKNPVLTKDIKEKIDKYL